jgi:hypothetical protein
MNDVKKKKRKEFIFAKIGPEHLPNMWVLEGKLQIVKLLFFFHLTGKILGQTCEDLKFNF